MKNLLVFLAVLAFLMGGTLLTALADDAPRATHTVFVDDPQVST